MPEFVDIYAADDDGYDPKGGFFVGNPAGAVFLSEDSNSAGNDIPTDWSAEPQLRATRRGSFVVIVTNVAIDFALCGPGETPADVSFVKVRVVSGGITQYAALTEGGRSNAFVRRSP